MLELRDWSSDLDLAEFYSEMGKRGFDNNSSQAKMIDCFKNEDMFKAWILYKDDYACGSVVTHSLPMLGSNSYRICARTASFPECFNDRGLLTKRKMIHQLQHVTAQLYIPKQIEYLGHDKDMFISSNNSTVASQRIVHNLWCPEMERIGLLSKECEMEYRGHVQSFWRLNVDRYLSELDKYPRWN